jgi:hypothetical protein
MKSPGALEFLFAKVIQSGLAFKLAQFCFSAFFHAAKMNEKALVGLMGVGASFFGNSMTESKRRGLKTLYNKLQNMDDNQLEKVADRAARLASEDKGYYAMLFMAGLLKF